MPRDWDAQDSVPAPPREDQWDTVGASAPPAPVLADGDYREQPWDYVWDDRRGQPADSSAPAAASIIGSADAGVQQALSTGHDEAGAPSGWPASRSDDLWDVHPTAATGRPRNRDLSPIGGTAPAHFQPLPERSIWTADYRPRPWYRTGRAVAAFAGAAAALVAAAVLVVTHTPSNAGEDSTVVAPQATTSPATPHTTAPTPMSSPAPPLPPPPPPAPPQVAPAPTWRDSAPRQSAPAADQPPRINVTRAPISVAPKPVTPPVTATPGHNGGWHW
jgi:hypothetical protein